MLRLAITFCLLTTTASLDAAEKPNIIFLLSDDVGLGNLSCCGGDQFQTPQLDARLAAAPALSDCFSTPLCGPSRCQLLTGRYPFRTGLISNHSAPRSRPTGRS